MKIKKSKITLPVWNSNVKTEVRKNSKHGDLFGGQSKRCLLVGASGCGKTNAMLSLIEHPNGLRFENIYLYCKSLYQPKYVYLRQLIKPIKEIGYFEYENETDIVQPDQVRKNSLLIFDDIATCNQAVIRDYFSFGRHKEVDCFYLCQTYSSIPKQLIRDNANMIVMFRLDNTNLKHIYDDHVTVDMSYQQFKDMCSTCWKDKYGFMVIDKDCEINKGRYRKGFDGFITL